MNYLDAVRDPAVSMSCVGGTDLTLPNHVPTAMAETSYGSTAVYLFTAGRNLWTSY